MNLREAAEKLSVPPAVLRIWRKRFGNVSGTSTLKTR
jgi:hypothetical protein